MNHWTTIIDKTPFILTGFDIFIYYVLFPVVILAIIIPCLRLWYKHRQVVKYQNEMNEEKRKFFVERNFK